MGRNVQLRKLISGVKTDLFPKTFATLVDMGDGKNAATKIAEIITLINSKTDMGAVEARIEEIVGSAPAALDTLKEIADALGNDADFAATMTTALSGKVDKVSGKGLSTEDFTAAFKTKLEGLSNYAHPVGDGNLHMPATGTSNNGKVLKAGSTAGSAAWGTLTASEVGAVPTTRKVNNKALSSDITLIPSDIGAATAEQGAKADSALQSIPFETTNANIKVAGTAAAGNSNKVADAAHVHPAQTSVTGNAGSATKLATARKINGVNFDGTADITVGRIIVGEDPGNLTENDLLMEFID